MSTPPVAPTKRLRYNILVDEATLLTLKQHAKERQTSVSSLIRLAMVKLIAAMDNAKP